MITCNTIIRNDMTERRGNPTLASVSRHLLSSSGGASVSATAEEAVPMPAKRELTVLSNPTGRGGEGGVSDHKEEALVSLNARGTLMALLSAPPRIIIIASVIDNNWWHSRGHGTSERDVGGGAIRLARRDTC